MIYNKKNNTQKKTTEQLRELIYFDNCGTPIMRCAFRRNEKGALSWTRMKEANARGLAWIARLFAGSFCFQFSQCGETTHPDGSWLSVLIGIRKNSSLPSILIFDRRQYYPSLPIFFKQVARIIQVARNLKKLNYDKKKIEILIVFSILDCIYKKLHLRIAKYKFCNM